MYKSAGVRNAKLLRRCGNSSSIHGVTRRYACTFNWEDPLVAANLFTEEELAIQDTAKAYCQERMLPRVLGTFGTVSFLDLSDGFKRHTG